MYPVDFYRWGYPVGDVFVEGEIDEPAQFYPADVLGDELEVFGVGLLEGGEEFGVFCHDFTLLRFWDGVPAASFFDALFAQVVFHADESQYFLLVVFGQGLCFVDDLFDEFVDFGRGGEDARGAIDLLGGDSHGVSNSL